MPATLLAVDDSQTMRKVLEMTFAGEDLRVITADSFDTALAIARSESPAVVLADVTLPGKSGYDLCQALKQANPGLRVLLLSSKLHPYDPGKGQAVKADGNLDKPFDTQQLIDRVKALLAGERTAPEAARPAQGAPRAAAPTPYRAPAAPLSSTMVGTPTIQRPVPAKPIAPAATPTPARVAPLPPAQPVNLRSTVDFSARQESPVRPAAQTPGTPARPAAPPPPPMRAPAPAAAAAPVVIAAAAKADGDMAAKLAEMGLSQDQVAAVLALSHDVVERVVWEVVPVLAETMIKEEIKRLMAE